MSAILAIAHRPTGASVVPVDPVLPATDRTDALGAPVVRTAGTGSRTAALSSESIDPIRAAARQTYRRFRPQDRMPMEQRSAPLSQQHVGAASGSGQTTRRPDELAGRTGPALRRPRV